MLYLHLGWQRTSTTSLQAALFEHRDAMAAGGVVYPERWLGTSGPTHHGISDLLKASQRSADALDELWEFLDANADMDVLLSAEVVTTWLFPDERRDVLLRFLATARDLMPTRCVWTLRRLEEAMPSFYLHRLLLGAELAPPAKALSNFQEPNGLFAGMGKVSDVVDDVIYVKYDATGTHNRELLDAFDICDDVAAQICDRLERGPRLNPSLSHKQAVALLNVDALSQRAGVEIDAAVLRAAIVQGDLRFEEDRHCDLVDDRVLADVRDRALAAARRQGFDPYLDFFGDVEVGASTAVELGPEVLTEDDLIRLAAVGGG
jgi:hypothetical protein